MTTSNLDQNTAHLQGVQPKLFDRIANLDIAFIKTKMEIERTQRKLRGLEHALKTMAAQGDKEEETGLVYEFHQDEMFSLNSMINSSVELLTLMEGVTKRIISHISLEEAKEILTLQNNLMRVYSNYNYHLPSIKKFEQWLKEQLQLIIREEQS